MKSCAEYQEKMLLDVHGELKTDDRTDWDDHVETCPGCRTEWDRLNHLIRQIQETLPCGDLTPEEAGALTASVKTHWKKKRMMFWRDKNVFGFPARLVPALGCAMGLILAMGWFGFQEPEKHAPVQSAVNRASVENMMMKDFEIIRNIEMLREMEDIQKLVKLVDERDV